MITLDVKNGEFRFVVFRRGRVVRWGMVAQDTDGEEQQVTASKLKSLAKELGLGGRWAVSLPLRAALVRSFAMQRIKKQYQEQVVAAEVSERIPFPLEQVDLAWSFDGDQAVAVVAPKSIVDRTAAYLKAMGVKPVAIYSRAMALAHMASTPNAVIVDLGVTSVGVVLVENGIPRLVHEMELANGWGEETIAAVSQAVEQMTLQYQEPEEGRRSILPVLITGTGGARGKTREQLEAKLGREVLALAPSLKLPAHFPTAEYAANLGLFLAYQARPGLFRRARRETGASVNLLPERHQPRSLPLLPGAVFLLIALLAYGATEFQKDLDAVISKRDALASTLVGLEEPVRRQRLERIQIEADRKRAAATEEMANRLEAHLGRMSQNIQLVMADLDLIPREAALLGVQLTGISMGADGYSVSGIAQSQDNLIAYASKLRLSRAFQDVTISSMQLGAKASPGIEGESIEPGTGRVNFQLKALTSYAALSSK
ncbi:MAG: PilN domain-containing protein [Chloroflexi bacterium]|nr:PilN domain-containing protein [Chloroflexota bacterium]